MRGTAIRIDRTNLKRCLYEPDCAFRKWREASMREGWGDGVLEEFK